MSLILLATCLSGVLFSKLLLYLGVQSPLIRYPLVATLSYLLFFVFIKLWLWYVATTTSTKVRQTVDAVVETAGDLAPGPFPIPVETSPTLESFAGGGGNFGGGGASGSFGESMDAVSGFATETGKTVGGTVGDLVPDLDENLGIVLLILGVLLAVIFGAGIFLIYSAPTILGEAAFEFVLAGSLIKSTKAIDDPDWVGSVFRTTWVTFALVLAIALTAGWVLHAYYPEVGRIGDLFEGIGDTYM